MKISEIRAKYPEYSDIPDEQLVIGLHRKFYADMPFKEFHKNIQYDVLPKEPETPQQRDYRIKVKEQGWGSGIPKVAYQAGGATTDLASRMGASPEVAGGAGYVANVATQAVPALFGYRVGEPTSLLEAPARRVLQTAIKPSTDDVISGAYKQAAGTMFREGINPTPGGMVKTLGEVNKIHPQIEQQIANSTAEVPIGPIGQRYLEQYERALKQATTPKDLAEVQEVWKNFTGSPLVGNADSMTVQMAHLLKRGTQQAVGSKNYGELGSSSTEAQKALARYLREAEGAAVPGIVEPLKRESALLNVLDVARGRTAAAGNTNPMGLAALRMDDPASFSAFMGDRSAYLKGLLARLLYQGGRPEAVPATVGAAQQVPQLFSRE